MFCPACGTDHPSDARFCMGCGKAFHDTGSSAQVAAPARPVVETRTFTIPFPEGAKPTRLIADFKAKDNKSYTDESLAYLIKASGYKDRDQKRMLTYPRYAMNVIWRDWKTHFEERINDLGAEGWQLAERFEPTRDELGDIARPVDRFVFEEITVDGFLGKKVRHRLVGAKFQMTRVLPQEVGTVARLRVEA